jgi:predicted lipoprotein
MKLKRLKSALGLMITVSLITPSHTVASDIDGNNEIREASEQDWKSFNNTTINQFVIPAYASLSSSAKSLHQNTRALCTTPSESTLKQSRQSFHKTMDGWQSIQNITFGPIEFSMRAHSMQFWPDKKNHIGKHLGKLLASNNPSLLSEDKFQRSSISVKGLPAIERILFGQSALDDIRSQEFRCQVLTTISQNVLSISHALHTEWQNHMREQFADAKQLDGYFEDDIDAATALLKTMIEPLEVIRDLKLKRPMGSAFGKEKYKRLESWRSERSLRNVELNIRSLQQMFTGKDGQSGLSVMLPKKAFENIAQQYEDLLRIIRRIDGPLEHAIQTSEGYQAITQVYQNIGELHTKLEKTAYELGIQLGFNSRDGD